MSGINALFCLPIVLWLLLVAIGLGASVRRAWRRRQQSVGGHG